jgi:hypothetical protein
LNVNQNYYLAFNYIQVGTSKTKISINGVNFLTISGRAGPLTLSPTTSWDTSGSGKHIFNFLKSKVMDRYIVGNSFLAKSSSMNLTIRVPSVANHALLLDSLELICEYCTSVGGTSQPLFFNFFLH